LLLVYGGTFDPPHHAHIRLPLLAKEKVGADLVAYVPAGKSPFKQDEHITSPGHRLKMTQLAVQDVPDTVVLTDEVERGTNGQPTYTVDTLEALRMHMDPDATMRLLIGGDQLVQFHKWRDYQRIVELAEPLVMVRPPESREELLDALPAGFDRDIWSKRFIDLPEIDISSTQIRRRISRGEAIDDLVPQAVAQYIADHNLYRDEAAPSGEDTAK